MLRSEQVVTRQQIDAAMLKINIAWEKRRQQSRRRDKGAHDKGNDKGYDEGNDEGDDEDEGIEKGESQRTTLN